MWKNGGKDRRETVHAYKRQTTSLLKKPHIIIFSRHKKLLWLYSANADWSIWLILNLLQLLNHKREAYYRIFYKTQKRHLHKWISCRKWVQNKQQQQISKQWERNQQRPGVATEQSVSTKTQSCLLNHLWNLTFFKLSYCVCARARMCVHVCACGSLFWLCLGFLLCNELCAPIWRNSP